MPRYGGRDRNDRDSTRASRGDPRRACTTRTTGVWSGASMISFRQLIASHRPVLLLDAASTRIQAAWFAGPDGARWETSDEEAGIGVFRCIERLGIDVGSADAFVFCDGPGSILGIRTVAMALRTWNVLRVRPMYAYTSLAVVAHALGQPDATVIADARRNAWHSFRIGHKLTRLPATELSGELVMPEHFRTWSPVPANTRTASYALRELWEKTADAPLLQETTAPDAFLHEEPSYVTWTPQIHRAPG